MTAKEPVRPVRLSEACLMPAEEAEAAPCDAAERALSGYRAWYISNEGR